MGSSDHSLLPPQHFTSLFQTKTPSKQCSERLLARSSRHERVRNWMNIVQHWSYGPTPHSARQPIPTITHQNATLYRKAYQSSPGKLDMPPRFTMKGQMIPKVSSRGVRLLNILTFILEILNDASIHKASTASNLI